MSLWICQCLCPDRHCILAAVDEAWTQAEASRNVRAPLRWRVATLLRSGVLNPWCALCGAKRPTWRYEMTRTRFKTLEEAAPLIQELQAANLRTNALWGDTHRTERPN